jgi:hypothetical protein
MTPKPLTLNTNLHIPETVYTQEINGEVILLDTEGGFYFGLDPVGTRMWQLMQQHGTLRTVFDTILVEYEVTPELLEADLLDLANRLVEKGLAVIQPQAE